MDKRAAAVVAGVAVLGCALVGGANGPQHPRARLWYLRLRKPGYTPPGPVVGATWTALEGLLAYTGYRLLRDPSSTARNTGLAGWGLTILGLAGYPWLFFTQRRLTASTVAAGGMLSAAAVTAVAARSVDKRAFRATAPLLVWLGFATVLSAQLQHRNRSRSAD
ncbi:hypothetical protein BH09PSE2_BH09PSE2_10580 [soil metagenome]